MAKNWSLKLGEIQLGTGPDDATPLESTPFRLLIMGDFSGRGVRGTDTIATKPMLVDRDNFDEVLARLQPEVLVSVGFDLPPVAVRIRQLEDFHPDRLYQDLEVFQVLRDLRQQLQAPQTFAKAAGQVRAWMGAKAAPAQPAAQSEPHAAPPAVEPGDLLEQILGQQPASAERPTLPGGADWHSYLHDLVAPHLVAKADPQQQELLAMVDDAIASKLRLILHATEFQALESAWRGLFLLVRGLDTDAELKLYFWDVSRAALAADLAGDELQKCRTFKLLVESSVGTSGGEPWAAWIGLETFGLRDGDVELLGRLGLLAAAARAPFLAAADSRFVGCASFGGTADPDDWQETIPFKAAEAWQALRRGPQAPYLGLVAPRFILRLHYGKNGTETEQIPFDELPDDPPHEHFLWGNAALVCGYLLASGFRAQGWRFPSAQYTEMAGLPIDLYQADGERQVKACAEAALTDRAVEKIVDAGLMTLQSVRDSDRVRLARWQSIADPPRRLAGRWE